MGTFESCKLKYDLSYNKGLYAEDTQQPMVTLKGNAFHAFAEEYEPSWSPEKVEERRVELETKYKLSAEFSLVNPVKRFIEFYNKVLQPAIDEGAKLHREISFDFELDGNQFTGRLDILLQYPDGRFHILDHKTKRSTSTTYYADQMLLYTWALNRQYGCPEEDLVKKVSISIFFPFADPEEPEVLKVVKSMRFNQQQLNEIRQSKKALIAQIEAPWEPEATLSKMCEFCSFAGQKTLCPLSVSAGLIPIRGMQILRRSWAAGAGQK